MITVDVLGDRRFIKTMREAGQDVKRLNEAHREAADIAAEATKAAAPVQSGRLARSIRVGATRKAGIIRAGKKSVPYANAIHWGWKSRGIQANPFMSKAAQKSEPKWLGVYEKRVGEILEDIEGI